MAQFDPAVHHRRSIRLSGYDYAHTGLYFVTICTHDRECWLGEVAQPQVSRTAAGTLVDAQLNELRGRFPTVGVDCHVVMPNHIHAIIGIGTASVSSRIPNVGARF